MALFRAGFGLYLVVYFATLAPHVEVYFSSRGVYVPYLVPDWAPPPAFAWVLFATMELAAVLLALGLWPRAAAAVVLLLFAHHYFLQLATKQSSFERLIFIYLVILAFTKSHHALAPGPASRSAADIPVWPERLLRFQAIVLYLGAGAWKAFSPHWHTGALLYATFQGMWATPSAFWLVRQGFGEASWTLLSWSVIAFELGLAAALCFRRTRVVGVAAGTIFHLANCVLLTIPEFLLCIASYAAFLPEEPLRRALSGRAPSPAHPTQRASEV